MTAKLLRPFAPPSGATDGFLDVLRCWFFAVRFDGDSAGVTKAPDSPTSSMWASSIGTSGILKARKLAINASLRGRCAGLCCSYSAVVADSNAALVDPEIRAAISTTGVHDQITVVPRLDASPLRYDPKPFRGYSDDTNIHKSNSTYGNVLPALQLLDLSSTKLDTHRSPGVMPFESSWRSNRQTGSTFEAGSVLH